MTTGELLEASPAPGVLLLTLNRPDARNAITLSLQRALDQRLARAADDDEVRVVVLAGAGERAFSAGYDLHELVALSPEMNLDAMLEREELLWRYLEFTKPTIAAVRGVSYGAGTLLAACSDLRVGGPSTQFTVTAAKYGGANLTWILDTLIGAGQTRDLLMTSRAVTGGEAHRMGLLTRYSDDDDVLGAAMEAATQIAAQPPAAIREIKSLLLDGQGKSLRSRYDRENAVARSTLRPSRVSDMFAEFLRGERSDGGSSHPMPEPTERASMDAPTHSTAPVDIWNLDWNDPFAPTVEANDEFAELVGAVRAVQESFTRARPTPDAAAAIAGELRRVAARLAALEVDEDAQIAGHRWDLAGRGQAMAPPLHVDEVTETTAHGRVTVGRFHSGRYAMNGGVTPLIFDEIMARLANGCGRPWARTAYLNVNFRAPAPLDVELRVEAAFVKQDGRKRFMSGAMYHDEVLVAEADGLWVELKPEQTLNISERETK